MNKIFKKTVVFLAAAAVAAGTLSIAACGETHLDADTSGNVESQGGFVVATGEYYYFINGVEDYTSDNTYGDVVKGSLMRIKKTDLEAGENTAEIVIPNLMVAADYTSGFYIYGDRIYYATPNNVKNTSGEIENDYLDFKSISLDGTGVKSYFRVSDNSTVYRYTEVDDVVYLLYTDGSDLHSYNTSTKKDTTLAEGVSGYTLESTQKGDPYIYYTMGVTINLDSDSATTASYNQIYRVRADATEAPYTFTYDADWLEDWYDENDGAEPYVNLGEIVLDGVGGTDEPFLTQFTHDYTDETELPAIGYTYTLQSYANGGIYFIRAQINASDLGSTVGTSGELYYLSASSVDGEDWNSIAGNSVNDGSGMGALDVVASAVNTTYATSSAIYYIEETTLNGSATKHHYLYVSGSSIFRADVVNDGTGYNVKYGETGAEGDLEIAYDASGATLVSLEDAGSYRYVYYTLSNGSGNSVERAVYSGTFDNYKNLTPAGEDYSEYKAVKVLDLEHASGWYNYEILDGNLFYVNAEAIGSVSYNYVYTVSLKDGDGNLLTNTQIEALNDLYALMTDSDDGYLAKLEDDGYSLLLTAIKYYWYTGETEQFWTNISDAVELGKSETYLYTQEEQDMFKAFTTGEDVGYVDGLNKTDDYDGTVYRVQSAFITFIGQLSDDDEEALENYWAIALAYYTEEEEGLAWWAWTLIGVAIGVFVAGVATVTLLLVLRSRKKKALAQQPKKEKLRVDTTDDREVDVYAPEAITQPAEEEFAEEEPVEDPAEEPVGEEPAEEESAAQEEEPEGELRELSGGEEAEPPQDGTEE